MSMAEHEGATVHEIPLTQLELPAVLLRSLSTYAAQVEQVKATLTGFLAGASEVDGAWALEITSARLIARPE